MRSAHRKADFYDLLAMAYHRLFPAWEGVLGGAATVR